MRVSEGRFSEGSRKFEEYVRNGKNIFLRGFENLERLGKIYIYLFYINEENEKWQNLEIYVFICIHMYSYFMLIKKRD